MRGLIRSIYSELLKIHTHIWGEISLRRSALANAIDKHAATIGNVAESLPQACSAASALSARRDRRWSCPRAARKKGPFIRNSLTRRSNIGVGFFVLRLALRGLPVRRSSGRTTFLCVLLPQRLAGSVVFSRLILRAKLVKPEMTAQSSGFPPLYRLRRPRTGECT